MKIKEIVSLLEEIAPFNLQEDYDNSGLILGDYNRSVTSILIALDVTEDVIKEAVKKKTDLIICHHPIIFKNLKKINYTNYVERTIVEAIKNDIAICSIHTNLDNVIHGVNSKLCEKLKLKECKVISPQKNVLRKLVTFVPERHIDKVRNAVFKMGGGTIGEYDNCSFNILGQGTFRANENTTPYLGRKGQLHFENEIRFETIFPIYFQEKIIETLINNHPYEEVAYDIYPLENKFEKVGAGIIGKLAIPQSEIDFLKQLKECFNIPVIRHTSLLNQHVKTVAVCGGSGSFLLNEAKKMKADIFISSDFKYHNFFDADNSILIADIGHYESEQFTKELLFEILSEKLPNFVILLSEINTNPINYYY